jgi:hypothetical protein
MKRGKIQGLILVVMLLAMLALPATALAKDLYQSQVIPGGNYTLESGQTHNGDLLLLGGNVDIQQEAQVNGNIVLFGGNMVLDGRTEGNVVMLGGNLEMGPSSMIDGDLITVGGGVDRAPGAQITGQVITPDRMPLRLAIPSIVIPHIGPQPPNFNNGFSTVWGMIISAFWFLFRVFITAALAVLVVLLLPRPSARTSQAVASQPALSFVVGLLTFLVLPVILVVMMFTIILIPVSLVGFLALAILLFFGWVSLGYFLGERMMGLFKQDWAPAVSAGVGTFSLSFIAWGFSAIVPCVGGLLPWVLSMLGLGAVLITRIGTQAYGGAYPPPQPLATSLPPAPPPPASVGPGAEPEDQPPTDEGQA